MGVAEGFRVLKVFGNLLSLFIQESRLFRKSAPAIFLLTVPFTIGACSLDAKLDALGSLNRHLIPVDLSSSIHNPTFENEIPVTLSFGTEISEVLTKDHLQITGGVLKEDLIVEDLAGRVYSLTVIPSGEGVVQIHFPMQRVSVPDQTDNRYAAASSLSLLVDRTPPSVQLTSSVSSPTGLGVIPVIVTFSETVTGLSSADFGVQGGTATLLTGSGSIYTLNIVPVGLQADIHIQLPASSAKDLAGNENTVSNVFTITYDGRSPTPTLSTIAGDPTSLDELPVIVNFDFPVTGLLASDFTVNNGVITGFSGSGSSYTFNIINSDDGVVSVFLPAAKAQGVLGINNVASNTLTFNVDRSSGGLSIAGPVVAGGNDTASFVWTLTYSDYQNISLSSGHVTVTTTAGVSCSAPTIASPSADVRTISLTNCVGDGTVGIEIESGSAQTEAGVDFLKNTSATAAIVDNTGPLLSITGPTPALGNSSTTFEWSIAYTDAQSVSLSDGDISFSGLDTTNCSATVSSSGNPRKVFVTGCTGDALVGISIDASSAQDIYGNDSLAANSSTSANLKNQGPTITIGAGSPGLGNLSTTFQWDITYANADEVRLSEATKETYLDLSGVTADCSVSVESLDAVTRRVKLVECSGDGNLSLNVAEDSARDAWGNKAIAATSDSVIVDNTGPGITIGAPDLLIGNENKSFSWLVTYSEDSTITLSNDDINLSGAVANCTKSVTGSGNTQRTVTVSDCTGDGSLTFTIAAGSARDLLGNFSEASAESEAVTIDNTLPMISISSPSPIDGYSHTSFRWTVTYSGANAINLDLPKIQLNGESTGCDLSIMNAGGNTRTVLLMGCTGHTSVGISIAAGSAEDAAGNAAPEVGPSNTVKLLNAVLVNFEKSTSFTEKSTENEVQDIPFVLEKALPVDININYRVTAQTMAVNPTNYDLVSTGFVTVPAGQTSGNISYQYVGASSGSKIIQVALDVKSSNGYNFKSDSPLHRKLVRDLSAQDAEYQVLSVGGYHTCGIRTGGALYCWGFNGYGQLGDGTTVDKLIPTAIDSSNTYTSVSVGDSHTCGMRSSGGLYCWGLNSSGQVGDGTTTVNKLTPTAVSGGGTYTSVSVGRYFTCGIISTGVLRCWGANHTAQLGNGAITMGNPTPAAVAGGGTYISVSSGGGHACGIRTGGALYCWGESGVGQVGDGTTNTRSTPTAVSGGGTYTSVSSGSYYTCGIRTGGSLYCWGNNSAGQLGDGVAGHKSVPTSVDSSNTYVSIRTGADHTCGLRTGGSLYCWGSNQYGVLGDSVAGNRSTPAATDSSHIYTSVGTGIYHTCGIRSGGRLVCWGANLYGELGDGEQSSRLSAAPIDSGNTYSSISTGGFHSCGIRTGGSLYCWGSGLHGGVGDGTIVQKAVPSPIESSHTFIKVSTGSYHTCGIRTGGGLYCWGLNSLGRLGDGTTVNKSTPVAIDIGNTYASLSAGPYHTCGIRTGGALYCWGANYYGGIGNGTTADQVIPTAIDSSNTYTSVSVGYYHTCGIRTGGALYCWGYNSAGQLGDGATVNQSTPIAIDSGNTYISVSLGQEHTCAVRTGGALYCWGSNFHGGLGDGTFVHKANLTPIDSSNTYVSISNGRYHTCGIRTGGTLACWGSNSDGQVGDGSRSHNVNPTVIDGGHTYTHVDASQSHTCGIRTGGKSYCWGSTAYGQLGGDNLLNAITPVRP